jgi:hypothetical protein
MSGKRRNLNFVFVCGHSLEINSAERTKRTDVTSTREWTIGSSRVTESSGILRRRLPNCVAKEIRCEWRNEGHVRNLASIQNRSAVNGRQDSCAASEKQESTSISYVSSSCLANMSRTSPASKLPCETTTVARAIGMAQAKSAHCRADDVVGTSAIVHATTTNIKRKARSLTSPLVSMMVLDRNYRKRVSCLLVWFERKPVLLAS